MSNSQWHDDQSAGARAEQAEKLKSKASLASAASMRALGEAVAGIVEGNPHQWEAKPCASCIAVSLIIGRPFGCSKLDR